MTSEGSPPPFEVPVAHEHGEPGRQIPLYAKIIIALILGGAIGLAINLFNAPRQVSVPTAELRPHEQGLPDPVNPERRLVQRQPLAWVDPLVTHVIEPIGKVFLRLVLMVVIPLVFSALSLGIVGVGDVRKLGRIGLRTLLITIFFSSCAVFLGVTLVNVIQPGKSLSAEQRELLKERYGEESSKRQEQAKQAKSLSQSLLDIIPENPLQEMMGALDGSSPGNGMLSVMFFALIFGIAMTFTLSECETLIKVLEGVFTTCMTIIGFAMRLAPLAVGCLFLAITSRLGLDIVTTLFWFVMTVLLGLAIQLFLVYPLALIFVGRMSPAFFFKGTLEAFFTAFGTSSSNATLPTALRVADEKLNIPPNISHFVLTVGATGNQNGTALFEGVVVLFLAQLFGVELTLAQQIQVVLMSVLAGVGTAGVPGGSIPLIIVVMQSVGVPAEGIGIILGVDRILDMSRTVLNVIGDLAVAACVAQGESTAPSAAIT